MCERPQQDFRKVSKMSKRREQMWPLFEKTPAKYHGLVNHGQTCYLNSILQVLFMTKEFRDAVISFVQKNPDTNFIDRHLNDLFDDLLKHQTHTNTIMETLGIYRVYEQQDAAEYFERILRLTCPDTAEIFHGQMTHRTTCSECGTKNDTDGPFWYLPLELVDSSSGNYSVEDGIQTYFSPTLFTGDNQMYCDTCDTKGDASSRYVIKDHPDVLILLLKRFDFSYKDMSYVKINRAVDVPYTLTLPEKQVYELYAFVDHCGDLRSGHYNATIKPQDEEETWYSFDDTRVSRLDTSPFPDSVTLTRSARAYLLFYRRKVTQEVCNTDQIPVTDLNKKRNIKPAKRPAEGEESGPVEKRGIIKSETDFSSPNINAKDQNTGEQMESRNLSSSGHQTKVKCDETSTQAEADPTTLKEKQNETEDTDGQGDNRSLSSNEEMRPDFIQGLIPRNGDWLLIPAGHERQDQTSDVQGESTDKKTENKTQKSTLKGDDQVENTHPLSTKDQSNIKDTEEVDLSEVLQMTPAEKQDPPSPNNVQNEVNDLENQNQTRGPEKEELVELVEVRDECTSIGSKRSAGLAAFYQNPKSVEEEKSGNVTNKETQRSATRSKHKDVRVVVGNQEESRTLLPAEVPENAAQPEVESSWDRHKYRYFIGIGIGIVFVVILLSCILIVVHQK
nr:ubiquitin carboxyl-terminal hydrolase 17-like protein A [Nothobranchius furzeri]XP_054603692.1 ubiquitin carboxyl-terminal hydrolase 17-like protein A [Nothobranchius furzeri]